MFDRLAQATNTYLTRHVAATVTALISALLVLLLWAASLSRGSTESAVLFGSNLVGLPVMGAAFLLAQHAKWQFVHPRARLMPHFAGAHLMMLGALVLLALGAYPLVASWALGAPPLGVAAFAALSGALFAWNMHTQRAVFMLPALATFFSVLIPQINGVWFAPHPAYFTFRAAALVAGWTGLGLWLWRLAHMTEEDDDYVIPVNAQTGRLSRMEKSEARRHAARMLSRGQLTAWITDRWHDRLSGYAATNDAQRRRLLRYGLAPTPAGTRIAFFLVLMTGIIAMQALMLSGAGVDNRGAMLGSQAGIFALIGPSIAGQLLAGRRARLAQELLLPMTRRSLVDGLLLVLAAETLQLILIALAVATAACAWLAPEVLTPLNAAAVTAAAAAVLPALVGSAFAIGLIESGVKRVVVMLVYLYAAAGAGAACVALSVYAGLPYGLAMCAVVAALGWMLIQHARGRWMAAEFG